MTRPNLLLHDSKRNVGVSWPGRYVEADTVSGVVLCLHNTPPEARATQYLKGPAERRDPVTLHGGAFLVDACSHVDLTSVDPDTYPHWSLWPNGVVGAFGDASAYEAHVKRVFEIQASLGAPPMIPSPALERPDSAAAQAVLDMLDTATAIAQREGYERPISTIAGTATFWSSGPDLDHFLATATSGDIERWHLVPVRDTLSWPVQPGIAELTGMMQATYTLRSSSEFVFWANVDIMGLPLAAAGATHIGTGYDRKQRCLHPQSHEPVDAEGGRWLDYVALDGALSAVRAQEAQQIATASPAMADQVMPGGQVPQGSTAKTDHHLDVLGRALGDVHDHAFGDQASDHLLNRMYGRARRLIDDIEAFTTIDGLVDTWLRNYERSLEMWRSDEGWK